MSDDAMEFPRTPEEFCEQYGFFDKDEVYTNGSLLIPVFRVEQMVEHYFNRTCEVLGEDYDELLEYWETELSCGHVFTGMAQYVDYCPKCGARVVKK